MAGDARDQRRHVVVASKGPAKDATDDASVEYAPRPHRMNPAVVVTALGVVFGDLGTSPLYTFKAIAQATGGTLDRSAALGSLSLIFWALIITISVKYCWFVMRADNHGEGGILALMAVTRLRWRGAGRIIRRPVARYGACWQRLWADHAGLVCYHRGAWHCRHCSAPHGPCGSQSAVRSGVSYPTRFYRLRCAGRGVSRHHRRRGALRRYGPVRPHTHSPRVVQSRAARFASQLCRANGIAARWRRSRSEPFLPACANLGTLPSGRFVDTRNRHRQSSHHLRR